MNCSIVGCPGTYEPSHIIHTMRRRSEIIVVDNVPAEVCQICGDVLLTPETVRHLEALLRAPGAPARTVPLYEYA